jgi:hypothetical protein
MDDLSNNFCYYATNDKTNVTFNFQFTADCYAAVQNIDVYLALVNIQIINRCSQNSCCNLKINKHGVD